MKNITEIIDKHFQSENIIYYTLADAIDQNNFMAYRYYKHKLNEIVFSVGSDDGQVDLGIFTDKNADKLQSLIELLKNI